MPLSAATTRYVSSSSWRTTSLGGTTSPATMLSVMSSSAEMKVLYEAMPSAIHASRSTDGSGRFLATNPPLAPTGTMTVFLTICALTRPSTSVRKSSLRSDQRRPPRATLPNRRWTPSTRGEYTQISYAGRGAGRSGMACGSNFIETYPCGSPDSVRWKKLVRSVALMTVRKDRRIRSSSREATWSSAPSSSSSSPSVSSVPAIWRSGDIRASKSEISSRVVWTLLRRVSSM